MSVSNHRASYLLYLLPFAKTSFVDPPWQSPAQSMRRVLLSIRLNGLPYNDFMLNRFCDILLGQTDKKKLFAEPLPEDYKDLQKLVWTFIVTFRKAISVQYSQEADVI
ncbi:hypothetical protein [Cohnella sp. GCM10027633]|uniref:hypothetical protein n=1 Tax=unclassified Cohnella TaxID=2636738 RepID=UPI003638D7AC